MTTQQITLGALLTKAMRAFDWGSATQQDLYQLAQAYLSYTRAEMITHEHTPIDDACAQAFWEACKRCQQGEPLAYILGTQAFFDIILKVTPDVLIPRSDTEVLVETVLQQTPAHAQYLLDLGTGSGAIALALAKARPLWRCIGMDRSLAALRVAKENSLTLTLPLALFQGCWTEAIAAACVDIIVANPPYLSASDPYLVEPSLQAEPRSALVAESAGLDAFMAIIDDARRVLRPQGYLFLEHGWQQQHVVADLLRVSGFQQITCICDYAGHPRVTWGRQVEHIQL